MGIASPVMNHVKNAHAFITKKLPVMDASQFTVKDSPGSTGFADKVGPGLKTRKTETRVVCPTSAEGRADREAMSVIGGPTGIGPRTSRKGEASASKGAMNNILIGG